MYATELWEHFWQYLAAYQLSETGFGKNTLILHLCVLLANTCSPLVMAYVTTRKTQRNRKVLARVTRRLLIFDSLCDLMYVRVCERLDASCLPLLIYATCPRTHVITAI